MQRRLEAAQMVALVGLAALFVEAQLDGQLHPQQCDCRVSPGSSPWIFYILLLEPVHVTEARFADSSHCSVVLSDV